MNQAAKLTVDMIQRRDAMRRLLGDRYALAAYEARAIIRGVAKQDGVAVTDAALKIAMDMSAKGHDPSIVIAALIDELEGES